MQLILSKWQNNQCRGTSPYAVSDQSDFMDSLPISSCYLTLAKRNPVCDLRPCWESNQSTRKYVIGQWCSKVGPSELNGDIHSVQWGIWITVCERDEKISWYFWGFHHLCLLSDSTSLSSSHHLYFPVFIWASLKNWVSACERFDYFQSSCKLSCDSGGNT